MRHILVGAMLTILLHVFGTGALANDNPKSRVGFYIEKYGRVDPAAYPPARRADEIFTRVLAVADKRGSRTPHLRIVNSPTDPWAIALPDGFIVLSKGAIDLCYTETSPEEGDARLAFILGHELGHLAEDDFWHLETYLALAGDPEHRELKGILEGSADVPGATRQQRLAVACGKELKADDRGFLYSAVAGFHVETLVADGNGRDDFFTYWVSQLPHAGNDPSHPQAAERAGFMKNRLQTLLEKIEFFRFGVRLAHFQCYDDAISLFREFQKVFPARETFNNLGYCCLRLATRIMPLQRACHFWLPTVLDERTQVPETTRHATDVTVLSEQARELLLEAAACFRHACEADPTYLPARVNLAVTCVYLDEIYQARAAVEEARRLAPDDAEVLGLRALIMYREDPQADMWPRAMEMLQQLSATSDAPLALRYNQAALLEERGRTAEAEQIWADLLQQPALLPPPLLANVRKMLHQTAPAQAESPQPGTPLPWTQPVQVRTDLLKTPAIRQTLTTWDTTAFTWPQEQVQGRIYHNDNGTAVLTGDDFVDMVVVPAPAACTVQALETAANGQLYISRTAGGTLYTYQNQWAALVRNGRVEEIWIAQN